MLESERGKLKTQVRRLADENAWLRQELQTSQATLQEVETELCKVKEERHHLNYLMSLPQVILKCPLLGSGLYRSIYKGWAIE